MSDAKTAVFDSTSLKQRCANIDMSNEVVTHASFLRSLDKQRRYLIVISRLHYLSYSHSYTLDDLPRSLVARAANSIHHRLRFSASQKLTRRD